MKFKLNSETFLSKKVLIPLGAILALIIILMLIFGNRTDSTPLNNIFALENHLTNLTDVIEDYSSPLKSSNLRSASASLTNVIASLSNAILPVTSTKEYQKLENSTIQKTATAQSEEFTALNNTLETARLNANLDATYSNELSYQIILLIRDVEACLSTPPSSISDKSTFQSSLQSSVDNLNALYADFQNYK